VLRNNVYADLLLLSLPAALASGRLVDARGEGRTAYVTREDCARTAAAALASGETGRRYLDVTGPEAVSSAELAVMAGELARRPVTHVSVPVEALIEGMVEHGMPRPIAELYASFDVGIARGQLAGVSDTVERLTGSKPQRLLDFLGAHRAALAGG
jgi:NAD(P)H dehydrogenase (quinone)